MRPDGAADAASPDTCASVQRACPKCGLTLPADAVRCPRCNAFVLRGCCGSCASCGAGGCEDRADS